MVTELYGFKYRNFSNKDTAIWISKNVKRCKSYRRGMIWWVSGIKKKERKYDF